MKYLIVTVTGLLAFSFFGCSTHKVVQTHKSKKTVEKPKIKKSPAVKKPQKKIIDDYKSIIYKNVAKSKNKKKKLAFLQNKREKLLKSLKELQASYPTSKNKALLNKQRSKITKELNRIEKEYKDLESKVVVENYTQKKSIKKD